VLFNLTNQEIMTDLPNTKPFCVVISGCSGGGKSTLLEALQNRGYPVVQEPGREVVRQQMSIGSDALPWENLSKFLELTLSFAMRDFLKAVDLGSWTFFDRSIIDTQHSEMRQPSCFQKAAKIYRYHPVVFLLPPWQEIYREDGERQHTFTSAVEEFERLQHSYPQAGYTIKMVPKLPVDERADWILQELGKREKASTSSFNLQIGGMYEHFKGGRYRIVSLAQDAETEEWQVVYRALYGKKGLWIRPLRNFQEEVDRDGSTIPRFRLIES
jgi:predicted ATPase